MRDDEGMDVWEESRGRISSARGASKEGRPEGIYGLAVQHQWRETINCCQARTGAVGQKNPEAASEQGAGAQWWPAARPPPSRLIGPGATLPAHV